MTVMMIQVFYNVGGNKKECVSFFLKGVARFCESIVDYTANAENAPYPDITIDRFYGEISATYDVLFSVWIRSNEAKVRKFIFHCHYVTIIFLFYMT